MMIYLFWTWNQPYVDSITYTCSLFCAADVCVFFGHALYPSGFLSYMDLWNV